MQGKHRDSVLFAQKCSQLLVVGSILLLLLFGNTESARVCHASFNNETQLETPCYNLLQQVQITASGLAATLELREYVTDATLVTYYVSNQVTTYQEALNFAGFYVIEYFIGPFNARNASLLSSRTVPLTLRPPTAQHKYWLGAMALSPSLWPPGSNPPTGLYGIEMVPFGRSVLLASLRVQYPYTPQPSDYDALCANLQASVHLVRAAVDVHSPFSPTHAYYYGREMLGPLWDAECWYGVTVA